MRECAINSQVLKSEVKQVSSKQRYQIPESSQILKSGVFVVNFETLTSFLPGEGFKDEYKIMVMSVGWVWTNEAFLLSKAD